MRIVKHKQDSGHVLFRYPYFEGLSDCDERIICLSERSMSIILNALEYSDKMRTRVYSSSDDDLYTTVSDTEWSNFQYWVSTVRTELGGYMDCNEKLERIAVALEAIQVSHQHISDNVETVVTLDEILDQVEETLGIGNAVLDVIAIIRNITPSLDIKVNAGEFAWKLYNYIGWQLPILAWMSASLTVWTISAAATVGNAVQILLANFISGTQNLAGVVGWVTGLWGGTNNLTSWLATIFGWFTKDEDGGEGGDDPDNDPDLRTQVNVATNITLKALLTCDSCGMPSGQCGCSGGNTLPSGGDDITAIMDTPPVVEPDREGDPPEGYGTWEEFDIDKCARAKHFLDNYINTLRNIGGLFGMIGGLTVAIIAGLLLIAVPPLGISFVLAALATLVVIDIGLLAYFTDVAQYLEDNIDELVCAMAQATTTEEMIAEINSKIQDAIASLSLFDPTVEGQIEAACEGLLSNSGLAYILESQSVPAGYEEYECPCTTEGFFYLDAPVGEALPTLISGSMAGTAVIRSAYGFMFGGNRQYIILTATGSPQESTFNVDSLVDGSTGLVTMDVYDTTLTQIYSSGAVAFSALVTETHTCKQVHIYGNIDTGDAFEYEFTFTD